jgi:hypothetical protein
LNAPITVAGVGQPACSWEAAIKALTEQKRNKDDDPPVTH